MIYAYTIPTLLLAFVLDAIMGDPYRFPHPVRFFGWMISKGTGMLLQKDVSPASLVRRGAMLSILVVLVAWAISAVLLIICARINGWLWFCLEVVLCWTVVAAKSLRKESVGIYKTLKNGNITLAREQLSMIVGRDTQELDEAEITKAVVETIAENTSDGVTAPMLYAGIGGAPLGLAYKAVNTLDSMIGYKNDKYLYFGRFAAKMDDVWNYIPARLTAMCMILTVHIIGFDGKNARRIYLRDRKNHASPNSGQTESVCAGALNIQLAGNARYFGKTVQKPIIGDAIQEIVPEDILRANRLMIATSIVMLAIVSAVKILILSIVTGGSLWIS